MMRLTKTLLGSVVCAALAWPSQGALAMPAQSRDPLAADLDICPPVLAVHHPDGAGIAEVERRFAPTLIADDDDDDDDDSPEMDETPEQAQKPVPA